MCGSAPSDLCRAGRAAAEPTVLWRGERESRAVTATAAAAEHRRPRPIASRPHFPRGGLPAATPRPPAFGWVRPEVHCPRLTYAPFAREAPPETRFGEGQGGRRLSATPAHFSGRLEPAG